MKAALLVFLLSMTQLLWLKDERVALPIEPLTYSDTLEVSAAGYAVIADTATTGLVAGAQDEGDINDRIESNSDTNEAPTVEILDENISGVANLDEEKSQLMIEPTTSQAAYTAPTPTLQLTKSPTSPPATPNTLLDSLNDWRKKEGKPQLATNNKLCLLAHQRAMEASVNFSHDGFYKLQQEGGFDELHYQAIAENLWTGDQPEAGKIIDAWATSEGHRKNMTGDYDYGCGAIVDTTAAFLFLKSMD